MGARGGGGGGGGGGSGSTVCMYNQCVVNLFLNSTTNNICFSYFSDLKEQRDFK